MKQFNAGKYDVIVVGAGHAGCEAALFPEPEPAGNLRYQAVYSQR